MSILSGVELAPRDPIFGLTEAFVADPRPEKVNLGVGVYCDDDGRIPLLRAVREAEQARIAAALPRGYLPIDGLQAYDAAVQRMLVGPDSPALADGRLATAQALGGTGALKIGADLLKRIDPAATVLISEPSWENHRQIFESAGFPVLTYRYYDPRSHDVDFEGMRQSLSAAAPGTIVVLHACCHNPTGCDLTPDQWRTVVRIVGERQLVPFLDLAYQGFADGIDADAFAVRMFIDAGLATFIASSFSKSFSLYGERVGALTVSTGSRDEAHRVLSQLKRVIRASYSNPPTHGGAIVAAVLADPRLRALWEEELGQMRDRIRSVRARLVSGLAERGVTRDFSFVLRQRGMFSYTGLTPEQVERLKSDHAVYAVSTGRICVAALNSRNIGHVCDAIAAVLRNPRPHAEARRS
jgi:aromatic-amino-acid transaminase